MNCYFLNYHLFFKQSSWLTKMLMWPHWVKCPLLFYCHALRDKTCFSILYNYNVPVVVNLLLLDQCWCKPFIWFRGSIGLKFIIASKLWNIIFFLHFVNTSPYTFFKLFHLIVYYAIVKIRIKLLNIFPSCTCSMFTYLDNFYNN